MRSRQNHPGVSYRLVALIALTAVAFGIVLGMAIRERFDNVVVPVALGICAVNVALLPVLLVVGRRLRREEQRRSWEGSHDALTGLKNRTSFYAFGSEIIERAATANENVALMLIDLDHFKEINDSLGHTAGDRILDEVSVRLRRALRNEDIIARLGGDEFALLIPGVANHDTANRIAEKVRTSFSEPFGIEGIRIGVEASIGIAVFPDQGADMHTLMQRADIAMYRAKANYLGVELYNEATDPHSADRLTLISDLRHAIENNELLLHYQPKALLADGRVEGVEALCRWVHPIRGFISPAEFIPIAEQTGLIKPITLWVVDEALRQASEWREAGIGLAISVNISAQNLHDPALTEDIASRLERWGAAADWLRLEITESAVMDDAQGALRRLNGLADMGLELAMDDYGTGYSSLSYLKRMPLTELKIDRSFVSNIMADQKDALIVSSTVELGHSLGLRVVAEGVETQDEWTGLQMLGCDVAQGFFLGRPMPPDGIVAWLEETGRDYLRVPITDATRA